MKTVKATPEFNYYSLATLNVAGLMSKKTFRALQAGKTCEVHDRTVKKYPQIFEDVETVGARHAVPEQTKEK